MRGGPTAAAPRSPLASAGAGSQIRTTGRTAREAHRRGGGRTEARSPVLARQRTGAYTAPTSIESPIATRRRISACVCAMAPREAAW